MEYSEKISKKLKKIVQKYGYEGITDRLVHHHTLASYLSDSIFNFHPLFNFGTLFNIVLFDNDCEGRIVARIYANPYKDDEMSFFEHPRGTYNNYTFIVDIKDYSGIETDKFSNKINECVNKVMNDFQNIFEIYGVVFGLTTEYFESMRDFLKKYLTDTFTNELKLALLLRKELIETGFIELK